MVSLDDAIIARYERKGMHFEILVDPHAAEKVIEGEPVNIVENLAIDTIFKDARKGEKASEEAIKEVFGTLDIEKIAIKIIKEGEIQLTVKQRREMQERKKKAIVDWIARSSMDPRSKLPHPRERIELAMEEARVHIDPFKPVEEQVKKIIDAIRPILPISIENVKVEIKIPAQYSGKAYGEIAKMVKMLKEEWLSDGSFKCIVEIPAGLQTELYDMLNKITKGEVITRLLK
ncbi:MAG: ribosome assembly factor SBDS [Thermoplasmata archaeon]|jgi:ribosome maturation protein SDO1|nr:MAG: ribosome assembly factor SBDS [Thermoplasmata archaeon]